MTEGNECLVSRNRGREPYFVFRGKFDRKWWAYSGPLGPFTRAPHRAANDVTQRAHDWASPQGQLVRVYPDAIEVAGNQGYGQIPVIAGVFIGLCLTIFSGAMCVVLYTLFGLFSLLSLTILMFLGSFVFSALLTWMAARTAWFMPPDAPLLFNRRTREVTVYHVGFPPYFKFWKKSNVRLTTCSWDQIKVRSFKYLGSSTGGMRCRLYLAWGQPNEPSVLMDFAPMGYEAAQIDDNLFALWEYVRRYMEEGGPAVPPGARAGVGYARFPNSFPQEVIDAAGGQAYTREQVQRMSDQPPQSAPDNGVERVAG